MDLLGYFRILWHRWVLIVALTVVGAALGVASTAFDGGASAAKSRTYYKATNTLILDNSGSQSDGFQPSFTSLDQIALLTNTGGLPDAVAKKLDTSDDARVLAEHVITSTNSGTNTLDLTAIEPTSDQAVAVANAFAEQLIADLQQRDTDRYNQQRDYLSTRINNLTTTVNQLTAQLAGNPADKVVAAQLNTAQNELGNTLTDFGSLTATGAPTARLSSLEKAQAVPISKAEYSSLLNLGALGQNHLQSGSTTTPTVVTTSDESQLSGPVARGLLGGLIGFMAGIALALLLERLNRRIRTQQDAEAAFALPVLAQVPEFKRAEQRENPILVAHAPLSRVAEAFRAVRSSLLFTRAVATGDPAANGHSEFEPFHTEPYVVMVTSPDPGEGKTTCTANLAAVFAEAGYSVLAINCDFRRPALHKAFGVADEPRRVLETSLAGVKIVTNVLSDPAANPSQVVAAQRQVILAARGRFDVILLDTAPLLTANDAVELVPSADVVVIVARAERTRVDHARQAV
jgi:Mrp family chromosome partitioning ATPase